MPPTKKPLITKNIKTDSFPNLVMAKKIEERTQTPGDPTLIANVLNDLIAQRDWNSGLAEGTYTVAEGDVSGWAKTSAT